MAQKNAMPTKEQKAFLERNGLKAACWVVVKDLPNSMIVKHRITGEFKVLDKKGGIVQ